MFSRIGLVFNPDKEEAVRMAQHAGAFFSEHGITVSFMNQEENFTRADLILTFGGDLNIFPNVCRRFLTMSIRWRNGFSSRLS